MSRFRRVIHGAASGYAVIATTALFNLASVPLALHYLTKERFALWALMSSIGGYLNLIDFGMSNSVARLLIDHKDERGRGAYGSLIKTGWLVLAVQGIILLVAGLVLAPVLGRLLDIPADLRAEFVQLMRWQSTALAWALALRISSHLLFAHQRLDVINYLLMGTLGVNFALLWFFFHAGQGVFSLAWANLLSSVLGALVSLGVCGWLGLFPPAGAWGRSSWSSFKEIFGYGKDLFLVAVGSQLIMASQTIIITRRLGLPMAAAWAVGTKIFSMILQMVCRISDVSAPAICEMLVRNEHDWLRERYRALLILTGSLSGFAAVSFALCNSPFVSVWLHGEFFWPPLNDVLLAVWLLVLSILHCHNGFVLLTKKVGFMRYVYFVEGIVFAAAAYFTAPRAGLPGVIACSVACSTLFSGAYGVWRVSRYFNCPVYQVGLSWLAPMGRVLVLFVPVAVAGWWLSGRLAGSLGRLALIGPFTAVDPALAANTVRLALNALLAGTVGSYLFLRYGLPPGIQQELLRRAPKQVTPVLRQVFKATPLATQAG